MRTSLNAADSVSVLLLATLIPQCLGRPASALFGKGHKALPLAERRDSVMDMERRDSLVDRRDSVTSRRDSAVASNAMENLELPEFDIDFEEAQEQLMSENQHQRIYPRRPDFEEQFLEQSQAIEKIVRGLGYDEANVEARQLTSATYASSTVIMATSPILTSSSSIVTTSIDSSSPTMVASSPDVSTSSSFAFASSSVPDAAVSSTCTSTSASLSSFISAAASTSTSIATPSSVPASSSSTISTPGSSSLSTSSSSSASSSVSSSGSSSASVSSAVIAAAPKTTATTTMYPSGAASATKIIVPTVKSTTVVGTAIHSPEPSCIGSIKNAKLPTLPASLLNPIMATDLQNNYAIYNGSGTLVVNSANVQHMEALVTVPSYSRDQGKGGNVAGYNMFVYADTMSYTYSSAAQYGNFTGMVSNSVALDKGLGPASGQPVTLMDPMGAYTGNQGALRGFFPMTMGEQAYNNAMNGKGQRIAIWPESSIIPLNPTSGLIYAPIVFCNTSSTGSTFTYGGTTLVQVTVPSIGGPVANRIAPLLFPAGGVEWGCVGGIRSYGTSGINGGQVYILGNHAGGLMLGRTAAANIANPTGYTFWQTDGTWTSTVPTKSATQNNFMNGSYSTVDIFYSPRHLTFMMVYQDTYANNNIYWRYLQATKPIMPSYAGGQWADIVPAITMYPWSNPKILVATPVPAQYYTYGGGMHPGYFGQNDISNGGSQMLLSWTAPTGRSSASPMTGYAAMHAVASWI